MNASETSEIVCYSYQRFSSPAQSQGDSLRRQSEVRDAFLARNPKLRLDTKTRMLDDGVSARKGKHRSDKHCLGQFIELVRGGFVKPGSILLVESLDRLSREEVDDALRLLLELTGSGVTVVQLLPSEVWYSRPVEPMKLMLGICELQRGWSESAVKSDRLTKAWKQKKANARNDKKAQTASCPAWLVKVGDKYQPIPERVATVRKIFDLACSGYGIRSLIKQLESEGVKPFAIDSRRGVKWTVSYIAKILTLRTVLGEYIPKRVAEDGREVPDGEPIQGYYPQVISEQVWFAAQAGLQERKLHAGGTKRNQFVNLFQGLMQSAHDVKDLIELKTYVEYRRGKTYRGRKYVNSLALKQKAKAMSFDAVVLEECLLHFLVEIDPNDILPTKETVDTSALRGELAEVEKQLADIQDQIVKGVAVSVLVPAAQRLDQRKKDIVKSLSEATAKQLNPQSQSWDQSKGLINSLLMTSKDDDKIRRRLRSAIRQTVQRIVCLFVRDGIRSYAALQVDFNGGGRRNYTVAHQRAHVSSGAAEWTKAKSFHQGGESLDLTDPVQREWVASMLRDSGELLFVSDEQKAEWRT